MCGQINRSALSRLPPCLCHLFVPLFVREPREGEKKRQDIRRHHDRYPKFSLPTGREHNRSGKDTKPERNHDPDPEVLSALQVLGAGSAKHCLSLTRDMAAAYSSRVAAGDRRYADLLGFRAK